MSQILLVEDNLNLALGLKSALRVAGYAVELVGSGEEALTRTHQQNFDLILLDIRLPPKKGHALSDGEGYDLCQRLRREGNTTPILMLTERNKDWDRVLGLDLGADDYVGKPFSSSELLARIRALLRRVPPVNLAEVYSFGDVEVDFPKGEVRKNGTAISLTPFEWRLLTVFIRNRGRVLSRDQLLSKVKDPGAEDSPRVIDDHVMHLRRKIEPNPKDPVFLVTVPGLGYRFDG